VAVVVVVVVVAVAIVVATGRLAVGLCGPVVIVAITLVVVVMLLALRCARRGDRDHHVARLLSRPPSFSL